MAYALSTSSHYGAGADAMAKSIEASTGGKYKVQQFANSALGGEREVIEGLQIGTIDLAIVSTGPPSILFPKPGFRYPLPAARPAARPHGAGQQDRPGHAGQFPSRGIIALAWANRASAT